MGKRIVMIILLVVLLASLSFILAQQPPTEAIDACVKKSVDDSCSFIGRQGETLNGICNSMPGGEIGCVPSEEKEMEKITMESEEESIGFFERIFNFLFGWMKEKDIQREEILEDKITTEDSETDKQIPKDKNPISVSSKSVVVDTSQLNCYNENSKILPWRYREE